MVTECYYILFIQISEKLYLLGKWYIQAIESHNLFCDTSDKNSFSIQFQTYNSSSTLTRGFDHSLICHWFCFLALVMVRITVGDDSTASPLSPLTGHFNVSGKDGKICILLDLSCSVSVQVDNTVSMRVK